MTVPEARRTDSRQVHAQVKREARSIERKLQPETYLIALDEKGQEMTSQQLSDFLKDLLDRGLQEITFVAGGAFGLPSAIRCRADKTLALSRMTLSHEMARSLLLEQVYRAITIWKGLPYHK